MNTLRKIFKPSRLAGALLALFSAASLLVTGYSLYISGSLADQLTGSLQGAARAAASLLDTSLLALQTTAEGLSASQATLKEIDQAFLALDQAIVNSFDLLIASGELTEETLPQMIAATRQSIQTAEETAVSIEAVLGVVSQIPFFPGGPYEPEVPLDQALGNVADDLDALTPALETMSQSFTSTHASMRQVQADILDIIIQLRKTSETLGEAEEVVGQYQVQVQEIEADLAAYSEAIPALLNLGLWFARFILLWIGILQGALLLYGIRLLIL